MSAAAVSFRTPVLAWSSAPADNQRYRRIQATALTVAVIVGVVARLMPPPEPKIVLSQAIMVEATKLLIEQAPPPPPKKEPEAVKDKAPEAKPTEQQKVKPDRERAQEKAQTEVTAAARKKASGMGLLAESDSLADLRSAPAAAQLSKDIKAGAGVGAGTGVGVGSGADAGLPTRSMITSNATGGSGGINTAGFSRDTGGGGLAGRATTVVEGVAGGGGKGGLGAGANKGGSTQAGKSGKAARSLEELRLVFERNKGKIYSIYNRALNEDASLKGKLVIELKIAASGQVDAVRVVSSELQSPALESKLLTLIRQFDFGAKDVDQMVITYPLDFLPP